MADLNKPEELQKLKTRMGLSHIAEALFYVPRRLNDYRNPIKQVALLKEGRDQFIVMDIQRIRFMDRNGRPTSYKPFRAEIELAGLDGRTVKAHIFGNVWPWFKREPGETVALYADVEFWNGYPQVKNSVMVPAEYQGKLIPEYPAIRSKVSSENMLEITSQALAYSRDAATLLAANVGLSDAELSSKLGCTSLEDLLLNIHAPSSIKEWMEALNQVKTLSKIEIIEKAQAISSRPSVKRSVFLVDDSVPESLSGITLTSDQCKAAFEVLTDLRSPKPMRRLLSGDVGTGKTISFLIPVAAAYEAGAKVAILVPNQPLATQIQTELAKFYPNVRTELVTSKAKPSDNTSVLIGTTALVHYASKTGYKPDFLVIDEQHKFSRDQREAIADSHTNILEATATAIPRSLALVTHGGMDVSILRQSPVNKVIHTELFEYDERKQVLDRMNSVIASGGQVAIVYPLVNEDKGNADGLKTVEDSYLVWEKRFPGKVGMVHGKMSSEEKIAVIDRMKAGEISLLVTSTVIEVGITMPDLKQVVVVNPERYGLTSLHQLRGRNVRHGGEGYMSLLLTGEIATDARLRLNQFVSENDGFKLAELDMENRGFGDLDTDSDDQSGDARMSFKNINIAVNEFTEFAKQYAPDIEVDVKPARLKR